jgi:hypothetical protein
VGPNNYEHFYLFVRQLPLLSFLIVFTPPPPPPPTSFTPSEREEVMKG